MTRVTATGALSASLVHELSQPLTSLGLNLKALQRGIQSPEANINQAHLIEQCMDSKHRLKSILTTVRSMFIDDHNAIQDINIREVLETVITLITKEATQAGIQVHLKIAEELWLKGRQGELQHALLNLVINAIQALSTEVSAEKSIILTVTDSPDSMVVSVTDNGPGVNHIMTDKLFSLLESGKAGGMGLGLWLCKHIVERHGGTISHQPHIPSGANFTMRFPKQLTHAHA